jgi:hypothetical protein
MALLKTEIKKSIYWTVAWILTLINFITFIVSRSKFWTNHPGQAWLASGASQDRTYLASEFERNLSCYAFLPCLRSGGAFISQFLINATTQIVELGGVNFDVGQKATVILLVGLLWRILCIGIFFVSISRLLVSLKASLLLTNTLIFVLGGLPLWTLGRILVNMPLDFDNAFITRANDAFYHMSYQDLFFYDYGFIAIIPLTIFVFSALKDISKAPARLLIVIGFILATFYEAFVPLVFLSGVFFGWKHKRELDLRLLWLVVGQAFWTLSRAYSIRFFEPSDPSSIYFTDTSLLSVLRIFSSKGMANTQDSLPSIAVQLMIVIFVAMTIGSVGGAISIILKIRKPISLRTINAANSVALATIILIAGAYLTPKLVELGRQSLGLTVATVIFGFITTQNIFDKYQIKQNSVNLGSAEN